MDKKPCLHVGTEYASGRFVCMLSELGLPCRFVGRWSVCPRWHEDPNKGVATPPPISFCSKLLLVYEVLFGR